MKVNHQLHVYILLLGQMVDILIKMFNNVSQNKVIVFSAVSTTTPLWITTEERSKITSISILIYFIVCYILKLFSKPLVINILYNKDIYAK